MNWSSAWRKVSLVTKPLPIRAWSLHIIPQKLIWAHHVKEACLESGAGHSSDCIWTAHWTDGRRSPWCVRAFRCRKGVHLKPCALSLCHQWAPYDCCKHLSLPIDPPVSTGGGLSPAAGWISHKILHHGLQNTDTADMMTVWYITSSLLSNFSHRKNKDTVSCVSSKRKQIILFRYCSFDADKTSNSCKVKTKNNNELWTDEAHYYFNLKCR